MHKTTRKRIVASSIILTAIVGVVIGTVSFLRTYDPIAAKINDEYEIRESEVTQIIQATREAQNLEDDEAWAQYLVDTDQEPASVRANVINNLTMSYLVTSLAAQEDISNISDQEVQDKIMSLKQESNITSDGQFADFLQSLGYTESEYTKNVKNVMLKERIAQKLFPSHDNEQQIVDKANEYVTQIDGAKYVRIFEIDSASNEPVEATGKLIYEGYNIFGQYDEAISEAIATMNPNENQQVPSYDGNKDYIIYVDEIVEYPANGFVSIAEMPEKLYEFLRQQVEENFQITQIDEKLQEMFNAATIDITEMPSGLPYDVPLDGIEKQASNQSSIIEPPSSTTQEPSGNAQEDGTTRLELDQQGNIIGGIESLFNGGTVGDGEQSIEYIDANGNKVVKNL